MRNEDIEKKGTSYIKKQNPTYISKLFFITIVLIHFLKHTLPTKIMRLFTVFALAAGLTGQTAMATDLKSDLCNLCSGSLLPDLLSVVSDLGLSALTETLKGILPKDATHSDVCCNNYVSFCPRCCLVYKSV